MAWTITNSYPYQDTLGPQIQLFTKPYPEGVYTQNSDEYPKYLHLNILDPISEPLPMGVFTQRVGEYPKFSHLKLIDVGAFANASVLREVHIPKSVMYIGESAFRNTSIAEVTINSQCKYYPTSFPDFCKINFYPD